MVDETQLCGLGRWGVIAGLTLTPPILASIWAPVIVLAGKTEDASHGFHVGDIGNLVEVAGYDNFSMIL